MKGYPLREYQEAGKVSFPRELHVAFAVCSKKCGSRQFIVDGGTQVCEYCGRSMFRVEVATYVIKRSKRTLNKSVKGTPKKASSAAVEPEVRRP